MARLTREQLAENAKNGEWRKCGWLNGDSVNDLLDTIAELERDLESVKGERNTIREAANGLTDEVMELRTMVAPGPCGKPGHPRAAWVAAEWMTTPEEGEPKPGYCTLCAQTEAAVQEAIAEVNHLHAQSHDVIESSFAREKKLAVEGALEKAALSCERRASHWAGTGDTGATQASIDIRAELLNEAATVRALIPSSVGAHECPTGDHDDCTPMRVVDSAGAQDSSDAGRR